jgi:hypothetical protein
MSRAAAVREILLTSFEMARFQVITTFLFSSGCRSGSRRGACKCFSVGIFPFSSFAEKNSKQKESVLVLSMCSTEFHSVCYCRNPR